MREGDCVYVAMHMVLCWFGRRTSCAFRALRDQRGPGIVAPKRKITVGVSIHLLTRSGRMQASVSKNGTEVRESSRALDTACFDPRELPFPIERKSGPYNSSHRLSSYTREILFSRESKTRPTDLKPEIAIQA